MRANVVVLVLAFFCFLNTSRAFGQSISISVKKQPLETVFRIIEKQSGYLFWCEKELLQKAMPVDLIINNATIEQALNACLKGKDLTYAIKGKTIVIKAKDKASEKKSGNSKGLIVTGQVTSENATVVPGVSIRQKGLQRTTVTDKEGKFSIEVTDFNAILQFSYVGYELKEVLAGNAKVVTLTGSTSKLDEVQVIAYGTTTRRLSTSSISTVKAADIENQPVSNPLAALQGRVPGLVIAQTSGVAGSSFKIQIRGQSALDLTLSKNDPLFVIDGVPFEPGNSVSSQVTSAANNPTSTTTGGLSPMNSINPQDIESIDVLKDADATSIYGSRGANGVILITTKKGKAGTTKFNLNGNTGYNNIGRTFPMLNTQEYLKIRKEAFSNDGLVPSSNPTDPAFAPDITLWDNNRYTDFQKLLIGNTGYTSNLQGSITGGSEFTQFRIGGNYHRETSLFAAKYTDNIGSGNININHSSKDKRFSIQFAGLYSSDKNKLPRMDLTRYIGMPPNLLLYKPSGELSWEDAGVAYNSLNDITNPLSLLNTYYQSLNENISTSLNIGIKITEGLNFRTNMGYNSFASNETSLSPKASINPYTTLLPSSAFASASSRSWIVEPQLEYKWSKNFHAINAIAGTTFQNKSTVNSRVSGSNYASDLLLSSISAAGTITSSNDESQYRYTAFFGRINYNYHDRYIATISARRDGSSRFGPDKQFANFGSIGVAWLFSSEPFVKDALPFLSFGKLRSSYGTTGNDQIGDYKFLNLWQSTTQGYTGIPGLAPSTLFNPDYNWEINKKFEVAMELGFFNDKLLASVAYYNNQCNNQLIRYVLPNQTGFSNVVKNFPGHVQNSGWELTLNSRNVTSKNFDWTSAFNISIPKNKLISFPGLSSSSYKNKYVEGQSLSIIRAYHYLGIDQNTGLYTFEDVNKNGEIYIGDEQYFGNLDPRFTGGLQNNIRFRQVDLSFFFQFTRQVGPNYLTRLFQRVGLMGNQPTLVLNRWTTPGQETDIQKLTSLSEGPAAIAQGAFAGSDAAYTDASFIKLKNISLGYRLENKLISHLGLGTVRLYAETQNVWTVTNYKGSDPETKDLFILPPLRTFVFGAQITL